MILAAIGLYVVLQIGIAAWAARGTSDQEDYLVAGRQLGTFSVAMSLFATWFAAETVLATSSEVAQNGLVGARIEPFGFAAGLVALALLVGVALRRAGHVTIADYLRERYGRTAETIGAVLIAIAAGVWAAAQLYAFSTIIAAAAGIPFGLALAAAAGIVLIYTLIGGLKGDVATDVVQGLVLIGGLVVMFWLMAGRAGGVGEAFSLIRLEDLSMRLPGESWLERAEIWAVPIIGTLVAQEAVSRVLGARSVEVARRGGLLAALIYLIVGFLPILFGLIAPELGLDLREGDAFLPSLGAVLFPGWLYVILIGALLSAILSSVDSALLAASSVITENGIKAFRPNASPRALLRAARLATAATGLAAAVIAGSGESLRDIVVTATAVAGLLAIPVMAGMISRRGAEASAIGAIGGQGVLLVVLDWVLGVPGAFVLSLIGGLAGYGLGMAATGFRPRALQKASR